MGTVVRIVEELAQVANVEFGGAILRPHAFVMKKDGILTKDGEEIVTALRRAGKELINDGEMHPETLEMISRPLISEQELRNRYNQLV